MNKELLKEYLSSRYQGWSSFLHNVIFPIFGEDDFENGFETELLESQPERKQLAEATGIRSIKQVGMIYVGVEPLHIFDVTVNDRVMMERNRVNIQRLIRTVMDQYSCAFMLFHYEDDTRWDWRFTYCRKSGNKEETTDSKRYTFLLGPGQSCRTATDNFMALYDKRNSLEIKDIENAFNVEALSKEFFGKYKTQYEAFVNYMVDPTNGMRQHFIDTDFDHTGMTADKIRDREEKPIRDYVKKLLGRIVFLHFLQKKGWLGVPAGKEWGEGDHDFMLNIFKNANENQKENFLDEVLEGLFADGLDRNRSDQGDLYDTKVEGFRNCRIPYLNGGLFERDILDKKPSHFPASYFDDLLTMLSQYNFTIDENDPNDAEVGVDPEMLGRIFENLLEDNKDKGAFYTPKEIVQYMCRESLIAYLQTDQRKEDKECIRLFVTTHDATLLGDLKEEIDKKLCNVKICDPAIGSGAFPMGLLRELFFCRSAIEPNIMENAAKIKRHIIQNNIYGVDIERGAVDIARLRFWLSLIVDEKSPEALPNLDFKIMQGNSLLEQYKGADLSTMTDKKVTAEGITLFDSMLDVYRKNLRDKLSEYYACPEHDKKVQLRKDISDIVKQELMEQGIHIDFEGIDLSANSQFFLWHTWFHDVFSRPSKEGFDIVIGNPPYGAKYDNQTKRYYKNTYVTANSIQGLQKGSLDTYTLFIELGYNLLRKNGSFAYIVPISLTSSDSLTGVHRLLIGNCDTIYISSYAVRPKPVFENAVVNTSILFFKKTETPCQHLFSTKMHRRGNEFELQKLIDNINFVDVNGYTMTGRIPKIGSKMEKNILTKIFKNTPIKTFYDDKGEPIYYRTTGGRYFKVVTNYPTGSTKEKPLYLQKRLTNAIGCILSSSLAFWFYQIYSNNLDWKTYEIENFTIPQLSTENIEYLDKLYTRYLSDIEAKANIRTTSGKSTYNVDSFKEYKIVRSKTIIDEIDDYICPLYGLTEEETDFIKNYELEFRLAGE
ncbi:MULTISPECIES: Eco57I restriction-modification methylase domain-containing protein [Bacteroidales]|uniref:Eco57I restriction-modification methylase domain-containing protein n=1 Tax=Bacteroidales TaxID=171549 RepID=UPI000E99CEE8|nr:MULTISPECIES: N-6 DNA methylase [Bacteroidales]HBI65821.1 DNA modification methylase [Barnesiella intestinihominis]